MLCLILAIILTFFWWRALQIQPSRYPNARPGDVLEWQAKRIQRYRRYAGILMIIFVVELMIPPFSHWIMIHPFRGDIPILHALVSIDLGLTVFLLTLIVLEWFQARTWTRARGLRA